MWRKVKIGESNYFLRCSVSRCDEFSCVLYDLKESLCETVSVEDVILRVKDLNKRIPYDAETARNTLLDGDLRSATLDESTNDGDGMAGRLLLKLKYRVGIYPLNFTWHLRRQSREELKETFIVPLFQVIQGLSQQVEELKVAVLKKDKELKQYREIECVQLRRKTLVTKPFDFVQFADKYAASISLTKGLQDIANHLAGGGELSEDKMVGEPRDKDTEMSAENKTIQPDNYKLTSKHRKRKASIVKKLQMERRLRARKQRLNYESSQSERSGANSQPKDSAIKVATRTSCNLGIDNLQEGEITKKKRLNISKDDVHTNRTQSPLSLMFSVETRNDSGAETPNVDETKVTQEMAKIDYLDEVQTQVFTTISSGRKLPDETEVEIGLETPDIDFPDNEFEKAANLPENNKNNDHRENTTKSDGSTGQGLIIENCSAINSKSRSPTHELLSRSSPMNNNSKTTILRPCLDTTPGASKIITFPTQSPRTTATSEPSITNTNAAPVLEDISVQLETIKKELQRLEARRIADLEQRANKS